MTDTSYREFEIPNNPLTVFNRTWVLKAPWAHPLWHTYVALLYDLTTPTDRPPVLYREGMTHEIMIYALDPEKPATWPFSLLSPANHGYQFKAASNEAASVRITSLLSDIVALKLSPDTDFRSTWDAYFLDGVSLVKKARLH